MRIQISCRRVLCLFVALSALATIAEDQAVPVYRDSAKPVEERVADLLGRLTLEEKILMTSGEGHMTTQPVERLGVPQLIMADGPHGVRNSKATCFPTGVSMGATWSPRLIRALGVALARETRAKGKNVILGPCIGIHRTPLGGRNFESFTEDPYLCSRLAVAYVEGVQSEKIGTSVKHYAVNNQEWERTTISVEVDERTLREIYFPAFKAAVEEADAWTVMGAYNRINGPYCCASPFLLQQVLKDEWGFRGIVVSDWGAVHSTEPTANAGLDLEMPGPGVYMAPKLMDAVEGGEVSESVIDDKVRRILRVMFLMGLFDGADTKLAGAMDTPGHRSLSREVARQAIVLLKNEDEALPLDKERIKRIAVIGPNAAEARVGGGGSSTVDPIYMVSPLEGIKNKCGEDIEIQYDQGCSMPGDLFRIEGSMLVHQDESGEKSGLKAEYFDNQDLSGEPKLVRADAEVDFNWGNGEPAPGIRSDNFSVRWTGTFIPEVSGEYELGLVSDDGSRLFLDGELFVDNWGDHGPAARQKRIELEAGRRYDVRVEYYENSGGAEVKLGWLKPDRISKETLRMARESDAAVVFVGLTWQFEGEGVDRNSMELPGAQNELIEAVAAENPNTIVVYIGGTPIPMERWLDKVSAVLCAWYPGSEGGNAIAEILLGQVNPSGRLPVTFPKKLEDNPSYPDYPGGDGKVFYREGLYVGYRHYDKFDVDPLFPFGHGLSYTEFAYDNLQISKAGEVDGGLYRVTLDVTNIGSRKGREVVQLYVRDEVASVDRPVKELKGFEKVLLAPGETKSVSFILDEASFSFFDPEKKEWVAEPGTFEIMVGSSSRDIRLTGELSL